MDKGANQRIYFHQLRWTLRHSTKREVHDIPTNQAKALLWFCRLQTRSLMCLPAFLYFILQHLCEVWLWVVLYYTSLFMTLFTFVTQRRESKSVSSVKMKHKTKSLKECKSDKCVEWVSWRLSNWSMSHTTDTDYTSQGRPPRPKLWLELQPDRRRPTQGHIITGLYTSTELTTSARLIRQGKRTQMYDHMRTDWAW